MAEFKAVFIFKRPIFLIPFSLSALNITFSSHLILLCRHSYALSEGREGDILDSMILGLIGGCREQVAGTVTQTQKGRIWQ